MINLDNRNVLWLRATPPDKDGCRVDDPSNLFRRNWISELINSICPININLFTLTVLYLERRDKGFSFRFVEQGKLEDAQGMISDIKARMNKLSH